MRFEQKSLTLTMTYTHQLLFSQETTTYTQVSPIVYTYS